MSKEHLISKKRTKAPRLRGAQIWMATDKADNQTNDAEHVTSIENLEGRRGSIPLARLMDDEADFFELIESGNLTAIEKFLNVSQIFKVSESYFCGLVGKALIEFTINS